MMITTPADIDAVLLNDFQRDVPIVPRPFEAIARQAGIPEDEVIARLRALRERGAVSRFGATCRPNTAGASTLAAVSAPDWDVDRVAEIVNAQEGVNHSYLREHAWNIWFVVTGPDRDHVSGVLQRIHAETGLRVLDLPLVTPFNIDLGFDLRGRKAGAPAPARPRPTRQPDSFERHLMQELSSGLPLVPRPFREITAQCGRSEDDIILTAQRLQEEGFVSRFGVIVRHRALGWRANAMVVWKLSPEKAAEIGPELARVPGITLCYQRRAVPDVWPFTLYCMIHARSREEAMAVLHDAQKLPGLTGVQHDILFSIRCFRQTGALIETDQKKGA